MLLLIGVIVMACISGSTYAVYATHAASNQRVADKVRTDRDIADIARRIVQIERPTVVQLNRAVIRALKTCRAQIACRAAFMDAAPRGRPGVAGRRGPDGRRGSRGTRGARGKTGMQGRTGAQGRPGPSGAQGPRGPQGPTGAAGAPTSVDSVIDTLCKRAPALAALLCPRV